MTEIIIGPPGTGKTTSLLDLVDEALQAGTRPDRIGFVAFTRKAADEAITRACERFSLQEKQLPYFRTLHSLAFRILGLTRPQVMGSKHFKEFGHILGLHIKGQVSTGEGSVYGDSKGDRALFTSSLSRLKCISLEKQYHVDPSDLEWYMVERVHKSLAKFKHSRGLLDFTDMLEQFNEYGYGPEFDLLVVDEAQDLSKLQWKMISCLASKAKRVVVAGDDDQAIFQWAGADVEYFVNMKGPVQVLNKSYRTPRLVQEFSLKLISDVGIRREKQWKPKREEGTILFHTVPDSIDMSKGDWLILARNSYLLDDIENQCRREGFVYERGGKRSVSIKNLDTIKAWEELRKGGECEAKEAENIIRMIRGRVNHIPKEGRFTLASLKVNWGIKTELIWHEAFDKMNLLERSYMVSALRRGEKITKTPRIRLSTIHSAKGGEADNVVLFTDIARRTYKEMMLYPDNEKRVFYVGATRTRKNLHIIVPHSKFYFSMN